uniref:Transposase n=1 Tax=Steinernema glaseri TaxID=37863 RepID=A0A1I7YFH2_9BILA
MCVCCIPTNPCTLEHVRRRHPDSTAYNLVLRRAEPGRTREPGARARIAVDIVFGEVLRARLAAKEVATVLLEHDTNYIDSFSRGERRRRRHRQRRRRSGLTVSRRRTCEGKGKRLSRHEFCTSRRVQCRPLDYGT